MRYRREVDVPTGDLDLSVPVVVTQPLNRHLERSPPATAPNTLHSTGNTHTHLTQYWQDTYTPHTVLATHINTAHSIGNTHTHCTQYWLHTAHSTGNTHTHRTQYWQNTHITQYWQHTHRTQYWQHTAQY